MLRSSLAIAATMLLPSAALACGGFFCSAQPVDQQAERIIFVMEDESTVTSYVEITYQGEPEGFAWVVPVPEAPELDTWHGLAFNALDVATQPQFQWNGGCFDELAEADGDGNAPPPAPGGVDVLAQERVGPFDTATVASDDPRALVEWLRVNGYRVVPEMEPFIALYTAEGMAFLAMKLAPGEDADSIEPIKMTYRAAGPAVPLRLTAVAAQLEMGVKVWILADKRYAPVNVADLVIDDARLVMDPWTWTTNYSALVAKAVDEANGIGFVTELATPTADLARTVRESNVPEWREDFDDAVAARDGLADLLDSKPYMTRLYTRLSPEEMAVDPMFGVSANVEDVSNVHVVPDQPQGEDQCGQEDGFDVCAFAACGAAGRCAVVNEEGRGPVAGCACADGTVARASGDVASRTGAQAACGDLRLSFVSAPDDPALVFADPCTDEMCGENGTCVALNGFPACHCDRGFVAVARRNDEGMAYANCEAPVAEVDPEFYLQPIPEPRLPYPGRPAAPVDPMNPDPSSPDPTPGGMGGGGSSSGCSTTPGSPAGGWAFLLLAGLAVRRRR